jgi:hypothetical protein
VLTNDQSDAFIDDFEEPTGISLGWSSFNDVSPTINIYKIAQVAGGAVNTAHSGHYTGTGAKLSTAGGFGVGTLYNVGINPTIGQFCVDASAFTGVSFWAKLGSTAGANTKVSLNYVIPAYNEQVFNDAGMQTGGGDCPPGPTGTGPSCFNYPKVEFTLTTDWAQYTAPFASATGGSGPVTAGLIQEVLWLSPDADWDFYLDEIAFYSGTTAPTTAVGPNPAFPSSSDAGGD